ncbi:MAG: hypothetical protein D6730_25675 [Bacteroidetes bacterium]|nr:MAG: hypothetical protein D6730_25675 [Bacteroidota bacterium]
MQVTGDKEMQDAGHRMQVTGCRMQDAGHRMQVGGWSAAEVPQGDHRDCYLHLATCILHPATFVKKKTKLAI